jgi:hypothetical protein
VPADAVVLEFTSVLDLGIWSYTTVGVRAIRRFEAVIGDAESVELRWIPFDEVESLPLHPGFAARWPALRSLVEHPVTVIVDSANVVGSRPDGWWKDRAGAASTLLDSLTRVSDDGMAGSLLDLDVATYWPSIVAVLEGEARDARDPSKVRTLRAEADGIRGPDVDVGRAGGEGDDLIVDIAHARRVVDESVVVVTADSGLGERVRAHGCVTKGPRWLRSIIDDARGPAA